ncbi:MAG: serine hydrolase [Acidobacteriota bacterium]
MNKKRIPVAFLLLLFTVSILSVYPKSKSKFSQEKFEKYINKALKQWKVPGVAIGIIHKGYIIHAKGFGFRNIEKELPVTRKTLFPIGSTTKALTTFLMGQLVDEDKLSWDKPVREYLQDFKLYDSYATEKMRARDLVIHNSGLPRHDLIWYGSKRSRKEIFNRLKYLKNNREFRTTFQYQNLMYMTAGLLVGKLNNSSWEEAVTERIFKPLEMESSNFSIDTSLKSSDFSLPYRTDENGKTEVIPFYKEMDGIGPAGSINSNINDMLSWMKIHLDNGERHGKQLISKVTLKEIHTPQVIAGGTIAAIFNRFKEISYLNYGMGWFVNHYRGHNLIHHGGNIDGFSALVALMPDIESGVVILTNRGRNFLTFTSAFRIFDRLLGEKPLPWDERFLEVVGKFKKMGEDKDKEEEKSRKKDTKPTCTLDRYKGEFEDPAYGRLTIGINDSELFFRFNKFNEPLEHYQDNIFRIKSGIFKGLKFEFFVNEKGEINSVSIPLEREVDNIIFNRIISSSMTGK